MRLGIDIGGTKTAVIVLDTSGQIVAPRTVRSGHGPSKVLDTAAALARTAAKDAGGSAEIVSVGACVPGLVDPVAGTVRHAVNLGLEFVDLAGGLSDRLGLPVAVDNDVKAAALGAHRVVTTGRDGGGGVASTPGAVLAYLNLGTGLAAAVVRDGEVLRGVHGVAGEIGHVPVGGTTVCGCGQTGCLETLASGSALNRMWGRDARATDDPFAAAVAGDGAAAEAARSLCSGVGLAIELLVLANGAERVVIGGGLTSLGEPLRAGIAADLGERAARSDFVRSLELPDRFELLPPGLPVAALGAALLAPARAPDTVHP
jgi:predicted NBD/HSP70 family sugar kinase